MDINEILMRITSDEDMFIPALIAGAILVGLFFKTVTRVVTGISQERTKREIAAYIAEGSMTPEHGERVLAAGTRKNRCC